SRTRKTTPSGGSKQTRTPPGRDSPTSLGSNLNRASSRWDACVSSARRRASSQSAASSCSAFGSQRTVYFMLSLPSRAESPPECVRRPLESGAGFLIHRSAAATGEAASRFGPACSGLTHAHLGRVVPEFPPDYAAWIEFPNR